MDIRTPDRGKCIVDGCDLLERHSQRCSRHYNELRANGRTCLVEGCAAVPHARGWCATHYVRWREHGDPGEASLRRRGPRQCRVTDCRNAATTSADLCPTHARRKRLYGNEAGSFAETKCGKCDEPAVAAPRSSEFCREHYIAHVKSLVVAGKLKGFPNAAGYIYHNIFKVSHAEHRIVMEHMLGRPLTKDESPHHINGDRADNRPENLELWSTRQPPGQRVADKVAWAIELLELYAPELLAQTPTQPRLIT